MSRSAAFALVVLVAVLSCAPEAPAQPTEEAIPLPEHPRPDFARADWINHTDSYFHEK